LSAYEDGVWYKLTLTKIAKGNAKQSSFGQTLVLDFDDESGEPGPGCLASLSVNDSPGGKPSKLKGALNSLLGHDPSTLIAAFDDDTLEVEYADEVVEQVEVGLRLEARGEWSAQEGATESYKLVAFRPFGAKSKRAAPAVAHAAAAVDPDDIPF
jgi:hypothetical protein